MTISPLSFLQQLAARHLYLSTTMRRACSEGHVPPWESQGELLYLVQAGLSALPAGGLPFGLSGFPRKQLTAPAVLFLEMFNRRLLALAPRTAAKEGETVCLFPGATERQPSPHDRGAATSAQPASSQGCSCQLYTGA